MEEEQTKMGWVHVNRRGSGKRSYWEPIEVIEGEAIEKTAVRMLEKIADSLAEEDSLAHFPGQDALP